MLLQPFFPLLLLKELLAHLTGDSYFLRTAPPTPQPRVRASPTRPPRWSAMNLRCRSFELDLLEGCHVNHERIERRP